MPPAPNHRALSDVEREFVLSRVKAFGEDWSVKRLAEWARDLPPPGDPLRAPILLGLIRVDLTRRWQSGQPAPVEKYVQTFKELAVNGEPPMSLIQAEFDARRGKAGDDPLADLCGRFPSRAAELEAYAAHLPPTTAVSSSGHPDGGNNVPGPLPENFGKYRIIRPLGRGGSSTVYLARDKQLDRAVALKVPHLSGGSQAVQRFFREARLAARLDHPNLCQIHDYGEMEGVCYLTMPFIEGKPLSDYITRDKPQPVRNSAALVRKVAQAMEEAHRAGVVHRDLKPGNIMINRRNEPVVVDFGLAKELDSEQERLTRVGSVAGTPAYMAPEQVAGDADRIGPPTDVYGLGVVLYEMVTGKLPFTGPATALYAKIISDEPARARSLNPEVDPKLEAVIRRAMAKWPEERFKSMGEFAEALTDWLKSPAGRSGVAPKAAKPAGTATAGFEVVEDDTPVTKPKAGAKTWNVLLILIGLAFLLLVVAAFIPRK